MSGEDALKTLKRVQENDEYKENDKSYLNFYKTLARVAPNVKDKYLEGLRGKPLTPAVEVPAEDFLYQGDGYGNGVVTPINSFDRAMGVMYGKPNGVLDRAGRFGGAGGGGGNSNVIINIMGDPVTVTRTVRKVLRAERARGYGGSGRTSSI